MKLDLHIDLYCSYILSFIACKEHVVGAVVTQNAWRLKLLQIYGYCFSSVGGG